MQRQWSSYLNALFEVTGDRGDGGLETGFFEDLSMANMKRSWLNFVRKTQLHLRTFVRIDLNMFKNCYMLLVRGLQRQPHGSDSQLIQD